MARLIIFSTGLLLLLLIQLAQSADINGSSIVRTPAGDLTDETTALLAEVLVAADQQQQQQQQQENKLSGYFPDAKSAHLYQLLNSVGDKRNPNIYSFGLGKRSSKSNTLNPYSFGLGKRSVKSSPNPYSFGLGKRNSPGIYAFGLGKRPDSANRFGFGLGKRNSMDQETDQWLEEEYSQQVDGETDDEYQEEEINDSEEYHVNKRNPSSKAGRAFFPSHLRSAFFGGPQLAGSTGLMNNMNRRPSLGPVKLHTIYQQQQPANDLPNPGKRLPVYNFGLGK